MSERMEYSWMSEAFKAYIPAEAGANSYLGYHQYAMPGLLQIAGYAHDVIVAFGASPKVAQEKLHVRLARQRTIGEHSLRLAVMIAEDALLRTAGDTSTHRRQLTYLHGVATDQFHNVRIVPLSSGHLDTAISTIHLSDGASNQTLFREDISGAGILVRPGEPLYDEYITQLAAVAEAALPLDASLQRIEAAIAAFE